uniref:Uncharacterized protein n=1 Tax=Rhabditophanes sp. KR3021 TaxID=114890 RepID=A0AC35UHH5_9BILA
MFLLTFITLLLLSTQFASSLKCMTCNIENGSTDLEPCVDEIEICPEMTTSCSMLVYNSSRSNLHVRKFCTPVGSDISIYLNQFPQLGLCEQLSAAPILENNNGQVDDSNNDILLKTKEDSNVDVVLRDDIGETSVDSDTNEAQQFPQPPLIIRARRSIGFDGNADMPPAPPSHFSTNNMLCVCMNDLCNMGSIDDMINQQKTMSHREMEMMAVGMDSDIESLMEKPSFVLEENVVKKSENSPEHKMHLKKSKNNRLLE